MITIKEYKTSPEQLAKNREYKRQNKDKLRVQGYRSKAVLYINKYANFEDLEEFKKLIENREDELKNS